jgi:hypothetical protein
MPQKKNPKTAYGLVFGNYTRALFVKLKNCYGLVSVYQTKVNS